MTKYLSIFIPVGAMLAALALWACLPAERLADLMTEGGGIETWTLLAYGAALGVLCLAYLDRGKPRPLLAVLLATAFLGAREMDLHKMLTGTSVLRLSYYVKAPDVIHKLAAAALVASFFGCVLYLVARYAGRMLRGCRQAEPVALAAAAFVVTAATAKVLDRTASIVSQDLGWAVSPAVYSLIFSVEECLEFALPVIIAAAAGRFIRLAPAARAVSAAASQSNSPG
jgi:hypothetical protein